MCFKRAVVHVDLLSLNKFLWDVLHLLDKIFLDEKNHKLRNCALDVHSLTLYQCNERVHVLRNGALNFHILILYQSNRDVHGLFLVAHHVFVGITLAVPHALKHRACGTGTSTRGGARLCERSLISSASGSITEGAGVVRSGTDEGDVSDTAGVGATDVMTCAGKVGCVVLDHWYKSSITASQDSTVRCCLA